MNYAHSGAKLTSSGSNAVPDGRPQEIPSDGGAPFADRQAEAMLLPGGQPNPYVKLIMLTACANDVPYSSASCIASDSELTQRVTAYCETNMQGFLLQLGQQFPNATILVANYYSFANFKGSALLRLSSVALDLLKLNPLVLAVSEFINILDIDVGCFVGRGKVRVGDADFIMQRNKLFISTSTAALQSAVGAADASLRTGAASRVFLVDVMFDHELNAAWGDDAFVFEAGLTGTNDPLAAYRDKECGNWKSDGPAILCERAGAFHPNALGACRYSERFLKALLGSAWCSSPVTRGILDCKQEPPLPNCATA